ncbi:MAG: hypothetical protein R3D80_20050 [Paracoccaceae bacterium]
MDVMLDSALARSPRWRPDRHRPGRSTWPGPDPGFNWWALDALRAPPRSNARIDPIMHRLNTEAGAADLIRSYDAAGREGSFNEPVVDFALLRFCALPQIFDRSSPAARPGSRRCCC